MPEEFSAAPLRSARSLNLSELRGNATSMELIQPGDVLNVAIATGLEDQEPAIWFLRVTQDGRINIPLVGPVTVAGLRLTEAEHLIRDESIRREVYRAPHLAVSFGTRQSNRVTVVGAVHDPGVKELPVAASNLLDAIVAAGGLTDEASTVIDVRYPPFHASPAGSMPPGASTGVLPANYTAPGAGTTATARIDLAELEANGGGPFPLSDGVVLAVKQRPKPTISVLGLVHSAGRYDIPLDTDLRLLDAIALAGGRTMEIADKVTVLRSVPGHADPIVVKASVREAKRNAKTNIRLTEGDVVSVEETALTFAVETLRSFVGLGFTSPIPGF